MQVAIMQPYFLPYIGYFQLIAAADVFVIYDNIKYTKKGWINRNRFLLNGQDALFSLPLKKASDACTVVERELSIDYDRTSLRRQFQNHYAHAPNFARTDALLERIFNFADNNLFFYIHNAVTAICEHIGIKTTIVISSALAVDHLAKGQDKVIRICQALQADNYVNAIGGTELYSAVDFSNAGIQLKFLKSNSIQYSQFDKPFVPWLSIVDVLMFNRVEEVHRLVHTEYRMI
jgi:hypothetical protein